MAQNMESTYALRKAALARMAQPSSVAAVPNLGEIAGEYAAARGRVAAEASGHARDVAFAEKSMAEKNRQFFAGLDLDREQLDSWAKQNRWATAIAVANLGIQALTIPAALRQEEKQEAATQRIIDTQNKQVNLVTAALAAQKTRDEKFYAEEAARSAYNKLPEDFREFAENPYQMAAPDREYYPETNTTELAVAARRKTSGMPVLYQH